MNRFPFSVLDPAGVTIGYVLLSEDALTLASGHGEGATVLHESGITVWRESADESGENVEAFTRACAMLAASVRRATLRN